MQVYTEIVETVSRTKTTAIPNPHSSCVFLLRHWQKCSHSPDHYWGGNTSQRCWLCPGLPSTLGTDLQLGLMQHGCTPASSAPSHAAWVFYSYFPLSSSKLAVVNLLFWKFNKKLIGGRGEVISTLTIKDQLTSRFSSGQGKKSGTAQRETQFSRAIPFRIARPTVSRVLCPLSLAQFQLGIIFSAPREARIHSALLMTLRSASARAFGSVLPAGCHSSVPRAPIMLGQAACFPPSFPNIFLSKTIRRKKLKQKLGDMVQWQALPTLRHQPCELVC